MDNQSSSGMPQTIHHAWSFLSRPRSISVFSRIEDTVRMFSPFERFVLYTLTALLTLSSLTLVSRVSTLFTISVPTHGGELVEGEVGSLRFVNPVLALSQSDQDATALVYSGLMRSLPDGDTVPDIATSYNVSPDGKTYTFTLNPAARFHDGTTVTSADVAFTIAKIQDPQLKSPHFGDWNHIIVSVPDPYTIIYTLPKPYAPFIHNATIGILPKHIWGTVSNEEFLFSPLNIKAIGSGLFAVSAVSKDATGAVSQYTLKAFNNPVRSTPYINTITMILYPDQMTADTALKQGSITSLVNSGAKTLPVSSDIISTPLPRVFGIFFNQNHNVLLTDTAVRTALSAAIDRQSLVRSIFNNTAYQVSSPIPFNTLMTPYSMSRRTSLPTVTAQAPNVTDQDRISRAQQILSRAGWTLNTSAASSTAGGWIKNKKRLSISLATSDAPALILIAQNIADAWRAVGISVSVAVYPLSELQSSVIQSRNYDAILFGEVVGPQFDLYAFWDSKERNQPGLNLSMYINGRVDTLLEQARETTDITQRTQLTRDAADIITTDAPALFLYSPQFSYILPRSLQGVRIGSISTPSDRFANVADWYIETERVWKLFAPYVR
jgi:peptide/nickel transport system substrate-binding protein